jgi:flavin reductase (DIM6/NTAB) family NADH-FMN oxidoreductase RutF
MPKHKSLTAEQQANKFRDAAAKRKSAGLPTIAEAEAAVDARIKKNIQDHGA